MTSNPNKDKIGKAAELIDAESANKLSINAATAGVAWSFADRLDEAEALQLHTPILFDTGKKLWLWSKEDKYYMLIDKTTLLNVLLYASNDRTIFSARDKSEIVAVLEATGRRRWDTIKVVPDNWIQFADCVYNIDTGETHAATSDYFYDSPIPHKLGDESDTPVVDRLISEWVDEKDIPKMNEIMAYCMLNGYPIHRIFTFFGSGRNGKGQFTMLLDNLIGMGNVVATTLDRLAESRFEFLRLRGKKLATISETNTKILDCTDKLKMLAGEDVVPGEYKGGETFDFTNVAKLVVATNSLPETTDNTRGFFSRWIIIDFPNEFDEGKSVVKQIPEAEYENLCRKCMNILPELLERGKFTNEGSVTDRGDRYKDVSDPMSKFVREMCIEDWNVREPTFNFIKVYQEWCGQNRYRIGKEASIRKSIKGKFDVRADEAWHIGGERKNWSTISGIQIRGSQYAENTEPSTDGGSDVACSQCSQCSDNYYSVPNDGGVVKTTTLTTLTTDPPTDSDNEFGQYIKSSIYKVGYVRGLETFTATDVLMEMPREIKTTLEVVAKYLVQHQFDLAIDGDGGTWKKVKN